MRSGKRSATRWSRSSGPRRLRCAACSPTGTCWSRTSPASARRRSPVIARAIGGHDARIQCTADLTASDVIGQEIEPDKPEPARPTSSIPGPIFANAVVFDEFNRATPRLQSALLEAMEENVVTVGKRRHALPRPFF